MRHTSGSPHACSTPDSGARVGAWGCPLRGSRGFALIATLALMMLLVILALGLMSLSSISLRSSGHEHGMARAQANARLAMALAIGELQKTAGPDQRVSARAEIWDTDPATPEVDGVEQPHWTGVWKTYNPAAGADNQLDFGLRSWSGGQGAHWLVSNPTPDTAPDPRTWTGSHPSSVVIAKGLGGNAAEVAVPLVNVDGGRYGYWVSDEGVKAKVNLIDPTFNSSDAALSQLHLWSSHALPMQKILPVKTPGTDFRATPSAELGKVTGNASVALLSTVESPLSLGAYSPDITTYSYGVLSDVSRGGLKKDLTAAFEDKANFNTFADTYGNGARELYSAGTAPSHGGPLWYSLFYYYNTYKSVMPTPPGLAAGEGNAPTSSIDIASPPYTLTPRGYYIKYPDPANPTFLNGPVPVVIAYRVDVAISSYQDDAGKWRLQLQYYPQLVVCNPYSVRLGLADLALGQGLNAFRFPRLNLTVGGAALPVISINPNASGGRFDLRVDAGEMDSLEPGETRVFALDADQNAGSIASACNFTALKSAGDPDVSADHYRYARLADSVFAGTMDGDALVNMSFAPSVDNTAAGDRVKVDYLEQRLYPSRTMWPVMSSNGPANGRYGTLSGGGTSFASPFVPSEWSDRPISSMTTPYRVLGFFARLKGLAGSNSSDGYTHGAEGVPVFMGNSSVLTPFQHELSTRWKEVFLSPLGGSYLTNSTAINTTPTGETTWGDRSVGDDASGNIKRYILRDIPSQPLVSLGQFMHMPAYRYSGSGSPKNLNCGSMFTGGSMVPIHIPTDKTALTHKWSEFTTSLLLDDSFLANQALFDRFFLSTVPPANLAGTDNPPEYWTQFNAANSGTRLGDATTPFLNVRIKPYFSSGTAPALADLRDPEKAAANLMLDGAFNINSTSVPAWKALLSSLSGNRLGIWNATGKSVATLDATAATDANPIPRFWSASGTGIPNAPWDGLRVLTDAQIHNLAEQIVTQVKTRGPFLSMADFLNRRLGAASALTRAGALQAAIDNTSPDINQAAKALGIPVTMSGNSPPVVAENLTDAAGNTLNTAVGIPGYLMQQDLVQAFSPVMAARSDTFVIRSYGEAVNPATGETAKAWLEAVVQRTPEYIDQADEKLTAGNSTPAYDGGAPNVGPANLHFGRRFTVVQLRWLDPDEI